MARTKMQEKVREEKHQRKFKIIPPISFGDFVFSSAAESKRRLGISIELFYPADLMRCVLYWLRRMSCT